MLQIRLLGQFDVRLDGKRIVISSRAGQSLLAYLAMTAGTPHRREKLAGTLWPDTSDENARKNLRQELWRIRKAIPTPNLTEVDDYLLADEFTLTFNRDADYWLDVAILEKPDLDIHSLTSSLSLYQGELLPGFYDDWIVLERERLQTLFESKMEQLIEKLVESERWTAVQEQGERWLALGFVSEPAYRALMLSHNARGDMAKVSSIYQRCVEDLRDHFGVEPSAETHALYNGLLKGAKVPRRIMPAQPSGTVTFLFTDIQGSTRLLDKLGEHYANSLAEHHHILRAAIQKWKGTEVDTQGDAFFVTFTRALDAVQCAADAQHALASHTWPQDEPIRVRMGLHTGEPLIASTGYVGMDVHRAARIGDAGHGGQVLLSQTTRDLVIQDLPPGITIKDLGEHRLKDMKYPTPIYQLLIDGLQTDFPPLKTKFTGTEAPTPGEPPFKGLQYFDEEDSSLFFGRELLTAKLVNRLKESRFLSVIIGASGSGKSSLVRAGLIPALKIGRELLDGTRPPEGSADWQIHIITPTAHPLEALATELTRGSESVMAAATLLDDLTKDPRSLNLFLARKKPKQHTLLVIDQFEELFTLCRDEFEREAFIDNLLAAIEQDGGRITIVITLRADFYAHLAEYPELRDAVAKQQEYIGPMTTEELRRAIEEPAKRGYWEFEPGLVDLILRDVGDEPGALPLLSHALLETWKRRAGHTLTLKGYADAGGVRGAIAHTAETVYQHLAPEEQTIARDIFLRLTELGEGTEDTRRRASFAELMSSAKNTDEVRAVLNILAGARLITLGEDTAEVAHEALIREWPTLREWLNQDREGLRLHRHLTEAAYEWELLGRDPGALYRGAHLVQAREWAALHPNALNAAERIFLSTSIEQEEREEQEREDQRQRELEAAKELVETQRQSASRLRIRNRVITTVGSIALILALLAGMFGVQSNRNAIQAETSLGIANEQRAAAVNAQATTVVESQIRATQQALAESNYSRAEAQRLAAEAKGLLLQNGSSEVAALLAIRSLNGEYTPQGDEALVAASVLDFPIQQFIGHTDRVKMVDFSPDGRSVVTGSGDSTARLWDVKSGKEIRQFSEDMQDINSVVFSPDGRYILTGSRYDHTVRLWDVETGEELRRFSQGNGGAFSLDGKRILILDEEGYSSAMIDLKTGSILHTIPAPQEYRRPETTGYSPDGTLYADIPLEKEIVHIKEVETGKEIVSIPIPALFAFQNFAFSSDNHYFAFTTENGAQVWDLETGTQLHDLNYGLLISLAFSPDSRLIVTGGDDTSVRIWDVETGQELRRFHGHTQAVKIVRFSRDGQFVLSGGFDQKALLWEVSPTMTVLRIKEENHDLIRTVVSSDGSRIAAGREDGSVVVWDAGTGELIWKFQAGTAYVSFIDFSPDHSLLVTWTDAVRIWDMKNGTMLSELNLDLGQNALGNLAVSSKYILATYSQLDDWSGGVIAWDIHTGAEVKRFTAPSGARHVVSSPDEKLLETWTIADYQARVFDLATGNELYKFDYVTEWGTKPSFSPDSRLLFTGGNVVSALWDLESGRQLHEILGPREVITSNAFSHDGRYVAAASLDGTVRIWDSKSGQEVRRITLPVDPVFVGFSADDDYLIINDYNSQVRILDTRIEDVINDLCLRLIRDFTPEEREQYEIKDDAPTCR